MAGKQRTKDKSRNPLKGVRLPLPKKSGGPHKSKKEYDRKQEKKRDRKETSES